MMEALFTQSSATAWTYLNPDAALPESEVLRAVLRRIPTNPSGGITQVGFNIGVSRADSFTFTSGAGRIDVHATNLRSALYAAYALLQLSCAHAGQLPVGSFEARPNSKFRSLKVYLPAPGNLDSFYRTVDMMCHYRLNTIIIEIGGAMEYKRHPEIGRAWIEFCRDMSQYPERANEVQHMFAWDKNSIHFENGGGQVLSQETVRQLIGYCRERGLDVIPEVPCLSHADYLVIPHPELAERPDDPYPDCYCPSHPGSYALLFDVLGEVIDVFQPEIVHIGHDEYYSIGVCEHCRGKTGEEIYAGDINKIHAYLKERGIRTMLWAEKLLNAINRAGGRYGGAELRVRHLDGTIEIKRPATYLSIDMIPNDVIAMHWYWGLLESLDEEYHARGIEMVYGNFNPMGLVDWRRRRLAGAQGGGPSHWSSLEEDTLQRNGVLAAMAYAAYIFWNDEYRDGDYEQVLAAVFDDLYQYKNRSVMAGPHFEITHTATILRPYTYISSLPMQLEKDTIGRYVVTYQDGTTVEIPIIYGKNITNARRDWRRIWHEQPDPKRSSSDAYVYDSLLIEVSYTTLPIRDGDETVFQMVVPNPHPDKQVAKVTVVKQFDDEGEIILKSFAQIR